MRARQCVLWKKTVSSVRVIVIVIGGFGFGWVDQFDLSVFGDELNDFLLHYLVLDRADLIVIGQLFHVLLGVLAHLLGLHGDSLQDFFTRNF